MIIVIYNDTSHVWAINKQDDDILRFFPKIFEDMYGVPVTKEELKIYSADGPEAKHHFNQHHFNRIEVSENGKALELWEFKKAEYRQPTLKVGDDDPEKPGTPVPDRDPRTETFKVKPDRLEKKSEVKALKLKKWPYKDHKKFPGDVKRMIFDKEKNQFE